MTLINSFLQPLLIRFHERNRCSNCGAPAQTRCRTHGTKICADIDCRVAHRRSKRAVYGDLTRPFCEYARVGAWKEHVLKTAVALAVGLAITALVAL